MEYLLAAAAIFAVNLLPAFGPPTWAVLVLFRFNSDLAAVPLVVVGALAAATGRYVLARATRRMRPSLSRQRRESLAAAQELLLGSRRKSAGALGLFALSPVPSAQLFVAAGLMTVPLMPFTVAFFSGRLVSYSIYVAGASAAKDSLGEVVTDYLTSPLGVLLQVVMLAGLVALLRVDWVRVLARARR